MLTMEETEAFLERVRDLTRVGLTCTPEELRWTYRCVCASTDMLRRRARNLVEKNPHAPTLVAYLADGWSGWTASNVSLGSGDGPLALRRDGGVKREYYLEHCIMRQHRDTGNPEVVMLPGIPRPMARGRTAWHCFESACEYMAIPRNLGCEGIVISVYVLDGALFDTCKRFFGARHAMAYSEEFAEQDGVHNDIIEKMTDWNFSVKCKAHMMQKSIEWALKGCGSEEVHTNAHIVIKSLRNTAADMHRSVDELITTRVQYALSAEDDDEAKKFWHFFHVHSAWLEVMVFVDPQWNGTWLVVNERVRRDPEGWRKLRSVILYLFRWFDWSDTRWIRSGRSSRFYLRSLMGGAEGSLEIVKRFQGASHEHLGGHARSDDKVRAFFAVAAVCSRPAEASNLMLLEDDRFFRFGEAIEARAAEEFAALADLPDIIWRRMCDTLGQPTLLIELRTKCMNAAAISMAYMAKEVFWDLHHEPHSITQGNPDQKLADLQARPMESIKDLTLRDIRLLLDIGYSKDRLLEGIALWRDAPCSIHLAENAHASCAILGRQHKTYSAPTLMARAALHKSRALYMPSALDKAQARFDKDLARLDHRCPSKVTGRHLLFGRMAVAQAASIEDVSMRFDAMHATMRGHVQAYDELRIGEHNTLNHTARLWVVKEEASIRNRREGLEVKKLALAAAEAEKLSQRGIPNQWTARRFTMDEVAKLALAVDSEEYSRIEIPTDTDYLTLAPKAPSPAEQDAFVEVANTLGPWPNANPPASWWCRTICRSRDY